MSEFGKRKKKPDIRKLAARAMRMHKREGITLKAAWKKVYPHKDRKKAKKYKKVSKAQKKKSSSMAKRAMRMHHREGITLKAAWRKVRGGRKKRSSFGA